MDEELRRIASIIKAIEELYRKLFIAEKRLGKAPYLRMLRYIRSRKRWEIEEIAHVERE